MSLPLVCFKLIVVHVAPQRMTALSSRVWSWKSLFFESLFSSCHAYYPFTLDALYSNSPQIDCCPGGVFGVPCYLLPSPTALLSSETSGRERFFSVHGLIWPYRGWFGELRCWNVVMLNPWFILLAALPFSDLLLCALIILLSFKSLFLPRLNSSQSHVHVKSPTRRKHNSFIINLTEMV